ncbi:MAG: hypothetical protein ACR2PF_06290, partial [Rhizobiaceae bacterium]
MTGYLNPAESFGDVYKPAVAIAVLIILLEGGLTLNVKEVHETCVGVRRMVLFTISYWELIRQARLADTTVYFGEVFYEAAHHDIVFNRYSHVA